MATADVFIGVEDTWNWNGCSIEDETARRYGIKTYRVNPQYVIDNYKALVKSLEHTCNEATTVEF